MPLLDLLVVHHNCPPRGHKSGGIAVCCCAVPGAVLNEPEGVSRHWRLYKNYMYLMRYGSYSWYNNNTFPLLRQKSTSAALDQYGGTYRGWHFYQVGRLVVSSLVWGLNGRNDSILFQQWCTRTEKHAPALGMLLNMPLLLWCVCCVVSGGRHLQQLHVPRRL